VFVLVVLMLGTNTLTKHEITNVSSRVHKVHHSATNTHKVCIFKHKHHSSCWYNINDSTYKFDNENRTLMSIETVLYPHAVNHQHITSVCLLKATNRNDISPRFETIGNFDICSQSKLFKHVKLQRLNNN